MSHPQHFVRKTARDRYAVIKVENGVEVTIDECHSEFTAITAAAALNNGPVREVGARWVKERKQAA